MTKPAEHTSTGATGATRGVSSEAHSLTELVEIQRAAFLRDGIPSADVRIDRITRLGALLLDNADEIAEALTEDFVALLLVGVPVHPQNREHGNVAPGVQCDEFHPAP